MKKRICSMLLAAVTAVSLTACGGTTDEQQAAGSTDGGKQKIEFWMLPVIDEADTQEINKEHEMIFAVLQKYVKLNLVVPVGAEHMYYAAINRKACKLTAQGQHYWKLVQSNKV